MIGCIAMNIEMSALLVEQGSDMKKIYFVYSVFRIKIRNKIRKQITNPRTQTKTNKTEK
jgi:hypothetical protein